MHRIADITVSFDIDDNLLHSRFMHFLTDDTEALLHYDTRWEQPDTPDEGKQVFRGDAFDVYKTENGWQLQKTDTKLLPCAVKASPNWNRATLYVSPHNEQFLHSLGLSQTELEEGYRLLYLSGLMECFRFAVLPFQRLYVHGVLMEYKGAGYLFSAISGTGKSTHTNLWVERYGARILDGDNAVVYAGHEKSIAYGLPWCGSSEIFENASVALKGIVFLEQSPVNQAYELDIQEAILRLLPRCFLPTWDEKMMAMALDTCGHVLRCTKAYVLKCRPDYESVEVMKQCLNI